MRVVFLFFFAAILTSCTDNQRARKWGGSETVELPVNNILVTATWKQDDLWVLTKDTVSGKLYFREKSSFGLLEGVINFKSK